jgi:TRAP-type uncharacterized transport system substrate-binding protein
MQTWRRWGAAAVVAAAGLLLLGGLLEFLAPDVAYRLRDRAAEWASGGSGRQYRIALGAATGSNYRVGIALNERLAADRGYELELVESTLPGNVGALLTPGDHVDLAIIHSTDDEAVRAAGVMGVAALEPQYFFVVVPNDNPAQEFRDLAGAVNPGVREPGQPPTLGERVLDYYGMLPGPAAAPAPVTIVRPVESNAADFAAGRMVAATRTQSLHSALIEDMLGTGRYRLVPIRDHDALARALPGTSPAFLPAGLYGPGRAIPSAPVPTITVTQLLVARADVPGRVIRDILESLYDPSFSRDVRYNLEETSGRVVGGLSLHPAAEIYYHRNDLLTADRLGRFSFVASAVAALFAGIQFAARLRRAERLRRRRRLLAIEFERLQGIRQGLESSDSDATTCSLMREADDVLGRAEEDALAGLIDAEGIQSLRSLHRLCSRSPQARPESHRRASAIRPPAIRP